MVGFDRQTREEFGIRNAKPGEWYSYGAYGQSHTFGRFTKLDDPFIYFDMAPANHVDDTGLRWELDEGEIAIPTQSITTFFHSNEEDARRFINAQNWHREYLGKWVVIVQQGINPAIGKVKRAYQSSFHLRPFIPSIGGLRKPADSDEQVVVFTPPCSIEVLTESALRDCGITNP